MKPNLILSVKSIKRFLVSLFVLLAICVLVFSMAACNKHKSHNSPSSEQTEVPDDNGNQSQGDNGNQSQGDNGNEPNDSQAAMIAFIAALDNVADKNATSTITVSFGGQLLSRKIIEYTRTTNGGTILTSTTTLAAANAQEPLTTTTDSPVNLSKDEFESKFPTFANLVKNVSDDRLQLEDNRLTIELTKAEATALLSLDASDATNIASSVQIVITESEGAPASFIATYISSNGNSVEIKIVYSL